MVISIAVPTCADALPALVAGDPSSWRGITPDCTQATVEAVLSTGPKAVDQHAERWGLHRAYDQRVVVWYTEDRQVTRVRLGDVHLMQPLAEVLGEPELVLPSAEGALWVQSVYPSRGLAVHHRGQRTRWVYGFVPMTVAAYQRSPLAKAGTKRQRRGE